MINLKAMTDRSRNRMRNALYKMHLKALEDDAWLASAQYIGDGRYSETRVWLDADMQLNHCMCSCKNESPCDHVAYLYERAAEAICKRNEEATTQKSHPYIRNMLSAYAARGLDDEQSAPDANTPDGCITVRPHLHTPGRYERRASIELRVGKGSKLYVVSAMSDFLTHVERGDTVSYGKNLTFRHDMARFDERSQTLLRALFELRDAVPEDRQACLFESHTRRTITLSPDALDTLYTIYQGECLTLHSGEDVRLIRTARPLSVALTLHRNGWLSVMCEPFSLCVGRECGYLVIGDTMGAIDAKTLRALRPFLDAISLLDYEMIIGASELPIFCQETLPVLRAHTNLTGDVDALSAFSPETLLCTVNLDATQHGQLLATVVMAYGNESFMPYAWSTEQKPADSVRRDLRAEMQIDRLINRWFHLMPDGRMCIEHETTLYQFLTQPDGLAALRELCDVRVSDDLRARTRVRQPDARVGVSVGAGDLLQITFDISDFPPDEMLGILAAYREKRAYYRLRDGSFVPMLSGTLPDAFEVADTLNLSDRDVIAGEASVPMNRAAYLDAMLRRNDRLRGDRDSAFRQIARALRTAEDAEFEPPDSLRDVLREYQVTGYKWMRALETYHMAGILADDMGLGKTLEAIAVLLSAFERGEQKPSLVVCPASLVLGWDAEIRRFAPALKPRPLLGTAAHRRAVAQSLEPGDVLITSYDQLKRDVTSYQNLEFAYQIIDEAQFVKNHLTQGAKSIRLVAARQRFALTGTPIENHLGELWSLFDFLMPGYLRTYARFKQLETPAAQGDEQARARIKRLTAPFILRRTKAQVLSELPPKTEIVRLIPLQGDQMKLYAATLMNARGLLQKQAQLEKQDHIAILALLTRLRQMCCHPAMCLEDYQGESAKLETCVEIVREAVGSGHGVLIFSQFTSLLAILRARLQTEGVPFFLLQGDTPKPVRASLVSRFNQGEASVFLISLKAGGTGLNLTRADVVIHFDPWWNVAAQNQATDRAHRIGQHNPVQVYKLIAQGTLEEKILSLQESKRELAESVLDADLSGGILTMRAEEILKLLDGE